MNMMTRVSPSATTMIRMDHTHVLATFHRYRLDAAPGRKHAIVETICTALEIHARLEEEIFYPAMRSVDPDLVQKSVPEHDEMRRLIGQLRQTRADDPAYDRALLDLMRDVMRHVADEETMLLPDAERVLGSARLAELGMRMTRRRFELARPRAGQIAINTVRSLPRAALAVTGVIVVGAFLAGRAMSRRRSLEMPSAARARALTASAVDRLSDAGSRALKATGVQKAIRRAKWRSATRPWMDRVRGIWAQAPAR